MANEFKILRGNKENLTVERLTTAGKLVNGYWYLTNDTAEVFVCLPIDPSDVNSALTLKKVNDVEAFDTEIEVIHGGSPIEENKD